MKKRREIDNKYKWNTTHLYESIEAFENEANTAATLIESISKYIGQLNNIDKAKEALDIAYACSRQIMSLSCYADRNKDVDMTNSQYQSLSGLIETLSTKFSAAAAWMEPEFLSLPAKTLTSYKDNPEFNEYARYFEELLRNKPHTLSKKEELIMAEFSSLTFGNYEIYSTFNAADMPFPKVTLSDNTEIEVNQPAYSKYRQSVVRADRKIVFDAFWNNYKSFENSIAKMLHYQLKHYTTSSKVRKYDSALHRAMKHNELPTEFYTNLIQNIQKILPALHSYLGLKKDTLEIDQLGYHDIYAPLSTVESNKKWNYEQAVDLVEKALTPMGEEYITTITRAMSTESGWIDVYPSKGKKSGAYMSGEAYDTHPYVLLNHIDDFNSVSTLAHEMGHAMHSYYSNKHQPFATSQYTIFVAEVASIFNEILLINHLIDRTEDKNDKIFYLTNFIENIRGTVFRQMQFAEFEDAIYKKVEHGESLTPEYLNNTYCETLRHYYGEKEGYIKIDPTYAVEWAFVPHFYYNYYVYQYVVGFIGGLSLATKVGNGSISPDQYINNFLKAGSSKAPLEILKDAGVDMMSDEPYKLTEQIFNEKLSELESLLKS